MYGKRLLMLATLPLLLALLSTAALAASATQTVSYNLGVNYQSVFGGGFWAPATLSGDIDANGQISRLRGSVYAPLGEQRLELDPTSPLVVTTISQNFAYSIFLGCDMFGCHYENHNATYTQQSISGNVDIRFGTLRGNGTLSSQTQGVCTSDCPPAYWWNPYPGGSQLWGAVLDNKDAGRLNAGGPAPSIQ